MRSEDKLLDAKNILAGTTLDGHYEILGVISAGGWGKVYKARQIAFDRLVAVKVLHPSMMDDPAAVGRFKREAKAASQIQSRYIASVYDHGVLENGSPYLVMQYFEGQDLAAYLRQKEKLAAEEAIPIFLQLCEALSAVHKHDIVHRDIKPANILVVKQNDGTHEAKLIDFGLVGMVRNASQDLTKITKTGLTLGTAAYMSPEQCRGNVVDQRSDIYSLGCAMYECLSGVQPFESGNLLLSMQKHLHGELPPLTVAAADEQVAEQLGDAVFCALEVEPENRFQTMDEFADELKLCVQKESKVKQRPKIVTPAQEEVPTTSSAATGLGAEWQSFSFRWKLLYVAVLVGAIVFGCIALVLIQELGRPSASGSGAAQQSKGVGRLNATIIGGTRADTKVSVALHHRPAANLLRSNVMERNVITFQKVHWIDERNFVIEPTERGVYDVEIAKPGNILLMESVEIADSAVSRAFVLHGYSIDYCVDDRASNDAEVSFGQGRINQPVEHGWFRPPYDQGLVPIDRSGSMQLQLDQMGCNLVDLGVMPFPPAIEGVRFPAPAKLNYDLEKEHVYCIRLGLTVPRTYLLFKVKDIR